MTQWYLRDKKRLQIEVLLMKENGINFELCEDEDGNLLWRGPMIVRGHFHRDVRLVYDKDHPYKPMRVYIFEPKLPPVNPHIHSDGSICYCKPEEWSPEWTALKVYLVTIRFLDEFYSGKMNSESYESPRGFLSWLLDLFRLLRF